MMFQTVNVLQEVNGSDFPEEEQQVGRGNSLYSPVKESEARRRLRR